MTATSQDIQRKMYEVETKRRAAQDAEQARIAAETKNRNEIAEAEAEIHRLQLEQVKAQVSEGREKNAAIVAASKTDMQEMYQRLDTVAAGLLEAFAGLGKPLVADRERQENLIGGLLQSIEMVVWEELKRTERPQLVELYGEQRADYQISEKTRQQVSSLLSNLEAVPTVQDSFYSWQAKASEEKQQRIRAAIGFILFGNWVEVRPDFRPDTTIRPYASR